MATLVLLDDSPEWLARIRAVIKENPRARDLDVRVFTSDAEATTFVHKHPQTIIGYVQDLKRSTTGGGLEGVRFLENVVRPSTPSAKTVILSAYASSAALRRLGDLATDDVRVVQKSDFTSHDFEATFEWLLERNATEAPAAAENASLLNLETLDLPWAEVCKYLARHPEFLHTMSPRSFERLVAEIFHSHGWDVQLTARTRDGGYDILAVSRGGPTNLRVLAEAKRYAPDRPVGVEILRALYGVRTLNAASQVVLATSSRVSAVAKAEFARVTPWELDFIERDAILDWCRRNGGVDLTGQFE